MTVFGKNDRTRAVALPTPLWSVLIGQRGAASAEAPVFPSPSGRALDRVRVRAIVRQAAERAGVDAHVSPHWLRHSHASHALDHGAPIHLVQATLGHSSVATTSGYLHARPGDSSALPGVGGSADRISHNRLAFQAGHPAEESVHKRQGGPTYQTGCPWRPPR